MISFKKIIKFIGLYFVFSAVIYFCSYAILKYEYKHVAYQGNFLEQMLTGLAKAELHLAIEDLENKSALFFIYWPRALQYALKVKGILA